MARARRRKIKNPEKVNSFRDELIHLYERFKADIMSLCKKYGVEINYWYSPSTISQPKFIIDNVGFTADELYNGLLYNERKPKF